jgi:outer membrane lipoprotein SlyB
MKTKIVEGLAAIAVAALIGAGCAGGPLTTREKGAGIGAVGGAVAGGIIGSTVGHPAAGALIGGGLGLGAGALIGDQMQGQENRNYDQQRQIDRNARELDRLKKEQGEY